jgi:tRNA pseudouridine55 synthase
MGRRRKGRAINGVFLLNKDVGGSSNQVLQKVRWLFQAQKAGHTGALDPLASGMLPICLGEATKFSQFLLDADKTYQVTARLGIRTTTSDADGDVVSTKPVTHSEDEITEAALSFLGKSQQIPSMFSALKYQGKPLYTYAREGIEVPRESREINVYSLTVDHIDLPDVTMTIHCSKGTYIRTIVDDLGEKLGCGAYVTALHRTNVANYPVDKMMSLSDLEAMQQADGIAAIDELLLPMDTATRDLPETHIDTSLQRDFTHGQPIAWNESKKLEIGGFARVYGPNQRFLGVGECVAPNMINPKRVVVYQDTSAEELAN